MSEVIKAWLVNEKGELSATVVFAETSGKGKSLARLTEACEGADFCNIDIKRIKNIDKYYKDDKWELDWDDPEDRLILVKECGFRCEYIEQHYCNKCSAREYCEGYQETEGRK